MVIPPDGYVVQWRSAQGSYEPGDEITVQDRERLSVLLEDMAGHGRYFVRVVGVNDLGRSEPSSEFFVTPARPAP